MKLLQQFDFLLQFPMLMLSNENNKNNYKKIIDKTYLWSNNGIKKGEILLALKKIKIDLQAFSKISGLSTKEKSFIRELAAFAMQLIRYLKKQSHKGFGQHLIDLTSKELLSGLTTIAKKEKINPIINLLQKDYSFTYIKKKK